MRNPNLITVCLLTSAVLGGCGGSSARIRLVGHHCSKGGDGSVLVSAQLANDGPTGNVQASGYVLLAGGRVVDASGWQYEQSIPGHQSDFFTADVPVDTAGGIAGCGVLLGDGAPNGVTREGDGGDQ